MQDRIALRIGLALLSLVLSSAAHALSFRTYLSATGSDNNPCTVQQPCRLLPAALAAVMNDGEVWILDSANYNTATVDISKSVSILAIPGALGSLVTLGGPAISISAEGARVSLRNLLIVPVPGSGGTHGIVMTNGESLTVHDSLIADLHTGVDVNGLIRVKIMDSVIRNGDVGVRLRGGAIAAISNSRISGHFSHGVHVQGGAGAITTATINDSVLSSNLTGLYASAQTGTTARWTAIRTTASNNETGFACGTEPGGSASCTVGFSMATGNTFGFTNSANGATFRSMGNNLVIDNGMNINGVVTPLVSP